MMIRKSSRADFVRRDETRIACQAQPDRLGDCSRVTGYSEVIQLDDKLDNRKLTYYVNLSHC